MTNNKLNYLYCLFEINYDLFQQLVNRVNHPESICEPNIKLIISAFPTISNNDLQLIIDTNNCTTDIIYILYARVSTKSQTDNNSLSYQLNNIKSCLQKKHITNNIFEITESTSAYTQIPELLNLIITTLKNCYICVSNIDRLSRNIYFFQSLYDICYIKKINIIISEENNNNGNEYLINENTYEYDKILLLQKILPGHIESCKKSNLLKSIFKFMNKNKFDNNHLILHEFIIELLNVRNNKTHQSDTTNRYINRLLYKISIYYNITEIITINLKDNKWKYITNEKIATFLNTLPFPNNSLKWTKQDISQICKKYA